MTVVVYVAIYAATLLFVAGCLVRILQYARAPFHLRWELYPVSHEAPRRVQHGGSYFESGEWWLHPQAIHHRGEWTAMFREIIFLRGLWEFNRRLWLPSFLFHSGLYLSIATVALAIATAAAGLAIPGLVTAPWLAGSASGCLVMGAGGAVLVVVGASWLLARRIADASLKDYTKASDIFNLLFFICAFACLAGSFAFGGAHNASIAELADGVLRFSSGTRIGTLQGVGLILTSALVAYIPYTHMSHFIAKYFTWHSVRWDDRRNMRSGPVESKVARSLHRHPTWAAPHIGADGQRSWVEIATSDPVEEVRK